LHYLIYGCIKVDISLDNRYLLYGDTFSLNFSDLVIGIAIR